MDSLTEYQRNLYNKLNRIVLNQKFEEDDENTKKEFQTFLGQLFEKPFLLDLFNYDQITSLCALLDTPSLLLKLKFKHDEKNDFQKFTNSLQKSIVNNPENTNFLISSSILLQNNILDFLFQHFDEHKNLQNQIDVIKQNLNKNNDSLKMLSNELNETKNNIQEDLNQKIDKLPKELNETKININININERINNFKEELKNINDKLEKTNQVQDSIHKNVCKIHPLIETVNLDDLKESGIYFIQHFEGTIGVHFPIQSTNEASRIDVLCSSTNQIHQIVYVSYGFSNHAFERWFVNNSWGYWSQLSNGAIDISSLYAESTNAEEAVSLTQRVLNGQYTMCCEYAKHSELGSYILPSNFLQPRNTPRIILKFQHIRMPWPKDTDLKVSYDKEYKLELYNHGQPNILYSNFKRFCNSYEEAKSNWIILS